MTRHPDHNRSPQPWGTAGHHGTGPRFHASRSPSRNDRSEDLTSSRPHGLAHDRPAPPFETPAIDIETAAYNEALWVHLRGEADLGNHHQLHAGLTRVELAGADHVHLVLTELTFCDVYCMSHLVHFAARVRTANQRLSAHGASPTIKKVARMLDLAQQLRFV